MRESILVKFWRDPKRVNLFLIKSAIAIIGTGILGACLIFINPKFVVLASELTVLGYYLAGSIAFHDMLVSQIQMSRIGRIISSLFLWIPFTIAIAIILTYEKLRKRD